MRHMHAAVNDQYQIKVSIVHAPLVPTCKFILYCKALEQMLQEARARAG